MNLIKAYVYEVTRRLPEKSREDIALELKSTIEDMLPDNHSEEEVKDALSQLGDPAVLAASYRDKPMHLIGPKVYDAYIRTMKLTIPWVVLITVLAHVVESIVLFTGQEAVLSVIGKSFGLIIANVLWVLTQLFFWMTIVFVMIERVGLSKVDDAALTNYGTKWSPEHLKYIEVIPRKKAIPKGEVIFGFIWAAIWAIVYFNADHLAGVYRTVDGGLQFVMPVFNQETLLTYAPLIVLFTALEIGLLVYKWKKGKWDMKLATVNAIIHLASAVAFLVIASNPNLINEAFIDYMAETIGKSSSSIATFMDWTWWIAMVAVTATILYEVYDNYRKAKIYQ